VVFKSSFQQGFLGAEMVIDRRQVDSGFPGDLAQGGVVIAVQGEKPFGGIEDTLPGAFFSHAFPVPKVGMFSSWLVFRRESTGFQMDYTDV
jgi:hypothetical protein